MPFDDLPERDDDDDQADLAVAMVAGILGTTIADVERVLGPLSVRQRFLVAEIQGGRDGTGDET